MNRNPYMQYYQVPNHPPPALPRLPAYNRASTAAYLLGAGPLPPPRPEDLAMAQLTAAMNNGAFEHPEFGRERPVSPVHRVVEQPDHSLEVRIPLSDTKEAPATIIPIQIKVSILPGDFLARIIANMDLDRETAKLGWKSCDDNKTAAPRRLQTDDDVRSAFREMVALIENTRRRKPVFMEIVNLTRPVVPPSAPPKPSECAASESLKRLKEKLKCAEHASANRWCWIKPGTTQAHVPLGISELSLWAREMHDGRADRDCVLPPNILRLDDLANRDRERSERLARRNTGQQGAPSFHLHLADSPLGDILVPNQRDYAPRHGTKRSRKDEASSSESEGFSDDENPIPITDILQSLHRKRPALNYPQYEAALTKAGIAYASAVPDFEKVFFERDVGMPKGAVGDFIRATKSAVMKGRKRSKRARQDKENED
ncbi:hypothetical protein FPV67DRAFT_1567097 [Lyophyllum atratum]|nr:hypothetical protein FPV67DRAFT_1567097 [Lyophyllum atratum]